MENQQNKESNTTLLTELLPQYRHLNAVYSEIIKKSDLDYDNQRFVTDFYQEYKNIRAFDQMLINLILLTDKEKQLLLMQSLNAEINKNIDFYNDNTDFLINIDTHKICIQEPKQFDNAIKHQSQKANEFWQELIIVRGNLESASLKGEQVKADRLMREEERINTLYKEEQKILYLLYNQQTECQNKAFKYLKNVFYEISELSKSFLSILENYIFNNDDTNKSRVEQMPSNSYQYFDMNIVSMIHKECNGIQFENITELDLYLNLNNKPSNNRLVIKSGEKIRVCYLIHKLYEHIKAVDKADWRNYILQILGIKESLYTSKYKECASECACFESQNFVKSMNNIFN